MVISVSRVARPERSATTIVSGKARKFKMRYSSTLNTHCAQPIFNSSPFREGGFIWHISCRPRGSPGMSTDFVSFYLALDDIVDEAVMTKVTFSLLDQDENPVPYYSPTVRMNFSGHRIFGYEKFIRREILEQSGHLKDGCFTLSIRIHIVKGTPYIPVPKSHMQQRLGYLLSTKEGADVEFRVDGKTFLAHRLVLGARSPVFKAEFYSPMKEGIVENTIQVDDMEAQVFKAMLDFIYTDSWPEMEQEDESTMTQHLLVAADKYCLERLKLICENRLYNHINAGSVATILVLAEKHNCFGLKEACFKFLSSSIALDVLIEAEEFEYLAQSCPAIMAEVNAIFLARDLEKAKISEGIEKAN